MSRIIAVRSSQEYLNMSSVVLEKKNCIADTIARIKVEQDLLNRAMFALWQAEHWFSGKTEEREKFMASTVNITVSVYPNQKVVIFVQPNFDQGAIEHVSIVRDGLEKALGVSFSGSYLEIPHLAMGYQREVASYGDDILIVLRTAL